MNIFFHGLESPTIKKIVKDFDLPWDLFTLITSNFKEVNSVSNKPELIVFTLFKGKPIKDFQINHLRKQFPTTKLLCLSNSFCMFLAEDLAQHGIDGLAILNETNKDDFLVLLENILRGEKGFPSLDTKTVEGLSIKELITIRHIAAGLSVKQVAYLWISTQDAIKERKKFIKTKLSIHTTEEISVWAALRMNIPKQDELLTKGEWLFKLFKEI